MEKKELRRNLREILSKLSENEKNIISEGISKNFLDIISELSSQKFIVTGDAIGVFSPLPDEFNWYLEKSLERYNFALPHMLDNEHMEFYQVELNKIKDGFQGLKLKTLESKVEPKVFLVPGLGFTKNMQRIGRGKGFYDRYLASRDCVIIGVCSELQVVDEIPTDEFDVEMNFLITDKEIYRRG